MSFFGHLSKLFDSPGSSGASSSESGNKSTRREIPVEPLKPASKSQKPPKSAPKKPSSPVSSAQISQTDLVKEAEAKAREIIVEARGEALKIREEAEAELRRARQSLTDQQRALDQKLNSLESRLRNLDKKEDDIENLKATMQEELERAKKEREKVGAKLESVAKLTTEEAKQVLFDTLKGKLTKEMAQIVRQKEEETKQLASAKSREILVEAMKHGVTDLVPEYTISVVRIPDEEVKGRIIGKGGRNIHTFERATGVDVDLDGSPNEVRLSCFDPIRREIAKISLQQLIKDGRIQPTRIEEIVGKVKRDMSKIILEEGKKICHMVGVYNLPTELVEHVGRLRFSVYEGQNLANRTVERVKIGVKLAKEVGANADIVRLGCLLQDTGKTVMDAEANSIELATRLLKKHNMPQAVIDCVAQQDEHTAFTSVEPVLVYLTGKIVSSRPGASYDEFEEHVARLEKLEDIAMSYDAVEQAFAIQAGREVRVILNPAKSKDDDVIALSHSIKEQIQNEMAYPGTVKITVIRESRAKKVAR